MILLFDAYFCLRLWVGAIGLSRALEFAWPSVRFALWAGPFETFSGHDAMNVLEVKLELLHRFKCFSALHPRMWTCRGFATVQLRNMLVDMGLPVGPVRESLHSCGGGKRSIA